MSLDWHLMVVADAMCRVLLNDMFAGAGQLETLKWLRAHGAEWNRLTFEAAAAAGQMQVRRCRALLVCC